MSTFSWSYKTASHRQPPLKKISTGEEEGCVDKCVETKKNPIISTLNNIQTGTPKRLNWKAKIYVGNLNKKTNEASLAYYFSVFGCIDDVKLIRDHNTNESRGFAFITFEKIESAEKAKKWCAYNYPTLDDNSITVASAERKVPKGKALPLNEHAAPRHPSQTLFWEYKWTNEPDAEVYGPYETSLMLAWKNQGYFDGGCWVRQVFRQNRHAEEKQVEEEVCEVTPAKKLKLMIDYSDSGEEDASGGEESGGREAEGGGEKEKGAAGKIREGSGEGESEKEATGGVAEEGSEKEEGAGEKEGSAGGESEKEATGGVAEEGSEKEEGAGEKEGSAGGESEKEATGGVAEEGSEKEEGAGEKEGSAGGEKGEAGTAVGEESRRRVTEEGREEEVTERTEESQGEEAAGVGDRERSKVTEGGEGEEGRREGGAREHEGKAVRDTGNETRDKVTCLTGRGEDGQIEEEVKATSEREQKHKEQENQHGRGGDDDDRERKTLKEYLRTDLRVGSEKQRVDGEVENEENDKEYTSSDDEDVRDIDDDLSTEFVDISEIDFNFFP